MKYFGYIFFLLFSFCSYSQINRCSTDEYRDLLNKRGVLNVINKNTVNNNLSYADSYINYNISVVVHVLYNNSDQNISDERIFSQIDVLNNDYNALNEELSAVPQEFEDVIGNVGLSFCLAQLDPDGNSCSGVNRVYTDTDIFQGFDDAMKYSDMGGVDAWDTEQYLNIWVCDLSGNTLGFATMPGDVSDNPELDGVVIDYKYFGVDLFSSDNPYYNLGRTGTHEIGHYFGLEHTFYAGCSDWDGCDDTPAISSPTYGCPSFPQQSCQSVNMTMNFMDYTNDACMSIFTNCQANIMVDVLLEDRSNLINSLSCNLATDELNEVSSLSIYPNPVADYIYLNSQYADVSILDIYGRKMLLLNKMNDTFLDVSVLPKGTYLLKIDNHIFKFIKN